MTKEINFKIIEIENYQVLISKDFEDDEENEAETKYLLGITFFAHDAKVAQNMGYVSKEKRDAAFDNITTEQIEKTVNGILEMFEA